MTYQPNLLNTRVRKKIQLVLGWIQSELPDTEDIGEFSQKYLAKKIGHPSDDLNKWLARIIMVKADHRYREHQCQKYRRSEIGCCYLNLVMTKWYSGTIDEFRRDLWPAYLASGIHNKFGHNRDLWPSVRHYAVSEFGAELKSLNFEYHITDKCPRRFHPLQNVKSEFRRRLLREHGLAHEYDIQCAAPTLLVAAAREYQPDLQTPLIDDYIQNRSSHRQELALDIHTDVDTVKQIINGLFYGLRLSYFEKCCVIQQKLITRTQLNQLLADPWIRHLRAEIHEVWQVIKLRSQDLEFTGLKLQLVTTDKKTYYLKNHQKWRFYFELEQQVIRIVEQHCRENNIQYFLEHDGWSASQELNIPELESKIKHLTTYSLVIDYTQPQVE